MNKSLLVLLISISFSAGANDKEKNEDIKTSALDPQTQHYITPKTSSLSKKGFLEKNKIGLGTILRSHHFEKDKHDYHDYNETHDGLYLYINRWSAGTFTNSADERSVFVTYNPQLYHNQSFMVNMVAGVANGYEGWENAQGDYLPIVGVSAQWTYLKTILTYDAVTFGLEVPLN